MLRHTMWLAAFILAALAGHAEADGMDDARIERLIRQLGSEKFAEREAASRTLEEAEGRWAPANSFLPKTRRSDARRSKP